MEPELSEFREANKSLRHKDSVFHMCLAGAVVASWSLTQEVTGLNTHFCRNIFQVLQILYILQNSFRIKLRIICQINLTILHQEKDIHTVHIDPLVYKHN